MVFFTAIIIILLLYFLEDHGIIFATLIALAGEVLNLFLIHFQTNAIKKTMEEGHNKQLSDYRERVNNLERVVKDMETLQAKNVGKISQAKKRIEALEKELAESEDPAPSGNEQPPGGNKEPGLPADAGTSTPPPNTKRHDIHNHLPSGSNRKKPPV